MHQNLASILWQLCKGKISFIILVPGEKTARRSSDSSKNWPTTKRCPMDPRSILKVKPDNTHFFHKRKFHYTANLLFIFIGFSCFTYVELATDLLVWSNLNQSNRRSSHIVILSPMVVSVLRVNRSLPLIDQHRTEASSYLK